MLLGLAQLAPFRPAEAKHLVQNAGALKRKRYRMQVTALNFHLCLCGCHLFPCLLPSGYCDCKPAALDFVSMPVAKTTVAKTAAVTKSSGRTKPKPAAKATSPAKPKAAKNKSAKGG